MKIYLVTFLIFIASIEAAKSTDEKTVGGSTDTDLNDPEIEALLKEHLPRIETGDSGSLKLVKKSKVTQQVVSGMLYKITGTFDIGEKASVECVVTIWSRVWLKDESEKTKIKLECGEETYRVKGDVPSGSSW